MKKLAYFGQVQVQEHLQRDDGAFLRLAEQAIGMHPAHLFHLMVVPFRMKTHSSAVTKAAVPYRNGGSRG